MATINCISTADAAKFRPGISNGEFNVEAMMDMTSAQRRALFEKYLPKDKAAFVNLKFEQAITSNQGKALAEWAKKTFKGQGAKKIKDITDRIAEVNEVLEPNKQVAFLEDLVADKLGVRVTEEEVKTLNELSTKLQELAGQRTEFGTPTTEYFKQREKLLNYVKSIEPSSQLAVLSAIAGKGALLASPKSAVTNVIGNTVTGATQAAIRRITENQYLGLNADYAKDFIKWNVQNYAKTGYDTSRMVDIAEDQKLLGENVVNTQGPGLAQKIGRVYESLVFNPLLGLPDVAYASAAFADSLNINTAKIAYQEGLNGDAAKQRALSLFKQATSFDEGISEEAKALRKRAISDAEIATLTDTNKASKVALTSRRFLNDIGKFIGLGNLRIGDNIVPFAKVPANVVARASEAAGLTAPWDIYNLVNGYRKNDPQQLNSGFRGLVSAGLGIIGGYLLSNLIDDDRFIGDYSQYDPKERELIEAEGATYNSVKIGDKWISLDYFGPAGAALVGWLNAKKYGKNPADQVYKYFTGAGQQLFRIPGIGEVADFFRGAIDISSGKKSSQDIAKDAAKGAIDFVGSRIVPALVSDVAEATDQYKRQIEYEGPRSITSGIQARIPGLRQQLEPKMDIFGTKIETEGFPTLLYGARVKDDKGTLVTDELNRLSANDQLPDIRDFRNVSQTVKDAEKILKKDEFNQTVAFYAKNMYNRLDQIFKAPEYQAIQDDLAKREIVQAVRREELANLNNHLKQFTPKK